jgi:hypothetical protein
VYTGLGLMAAMTGASIARSGFSRGLSAAAGIALLSARRRAPYHRHPVKLASSASHAFVGARPGGRLVPGSPLDQGRQLQAS